MGLIDRALNLAQKAYNYVVGDDSQDKPAVKNGSKTKTKTNSVKTNKNSNNKNSAQQMNSVVNPSGNITEKAVDKVVKTQPSVKTSTQLKVQNVQQTDLKDNKNTQTNSAKNKAEIQKLINKIQQKCQSFGISYEEAQKTILSQMQFSQEEFDNSSEEEQLIILYSIDEALSLYIIDKQNKIDTSVDKAVVLGKTARNIQKAKVDGSIDKIEDFKKDIIVNNQNFDTQFQQASTDDDRIKLLEEVRISRAKKFEAQRKIEIDACKGNKAKIAEVNAEFDARLKAIEAEAQNQFNAKYGYSKAHLSIYLRDGSSFADAHKDMFDLYDNDTKAEITKSMPYSFETDAKRRYYEAGDSISSKEFGKAIEYTTQYMPEEYLKQFEIDAYEFRIKVQNGELDAPYMTDEDFTAVTAGIGAGITKNETIDSDKKAELLSTWDKHAQNFEDYDEVRKNYYKSVKEYLEKHPDLKQKIDDQNIKYREQLGNPEITNTGKKQLKTGRISKDEALAEKNLKLNTAKDIAVSIKNGDITVTDAIVLYKEKAFDAIFENKELFLKNKTIAKLHINNNRKNLEKLLELSKFSSAVELIVQNISPTIKDEYIKEVELSGITKKAIFGKDEGNAAA